MRAALNRLRLRLMALTIVVGLAFVILLGGVTYLLVEGYLESNVDLALRSRMALEFFTLRATVPAELSNASAQMPSPRPRRNNNTTSNGASVDDDHHDDQPPIMPQGPSQPEGDLAAVNVLFLDASGLPLFSRTNITSSAMLVNMASLNAASANGNDLRTITADGERTRILTYRVDSPNFTAPVIVQVSRSLANQDGILKGLLLALGAMAALAAAVLGAGSWWLSGRSIQPAQQAWEQQQRFVANASHELRTPLTLIRASADVMQRNLDDIEQREGEFVQDQRDLLNDVMGEVDHTTRLVEDLLLLSRLDAHQLKLVREEVDAPAMLSDVQRQVQRIADDRKISVKVGAAAGAVFADVTRLRQILLILMDNALRHTKPGGSVTLEAAERGAMTEISVSDTGEGIAPDDLLRVFERFYQADTSHTTKGSAGLGLSIARGLVEAHGGRIGIESAIGQGTRVNVILPASA
ncbi:MAG TPA: HAMP domain-containing sensor histidine kinase [Thermoflexales bacterium]|nr:HAMP domain-containing sensor histidine kinase [Thermoflexales bacterium]HQZ23338.1 HAMP domain-containing sensor histidine kinase [Thermoflexales bacterium]